MSLKRSEYMKGIMVMIIILAVVVMSSLIVLLNISSLTQESDDYMTFNEAKQSMADLDAVDKQLLFESPGSARDVSFRLRRGEFMVDDIGNRFVLQIDTSAVDPETLLEEGSLTIERGPFVSAYEADVDGDAVPEYILENDAVLFALKAVANATSPGAIDLGGAIAQVKIKRTGTVMKPQARVFINGVNNTAGTGYTSLEERGTRLASASIVAHVETGSVRYDALFTLRASNDYIVLTIDVK